MTDTTIGPYLVLGLVNRGGGGSVYEGFDRRLRRRVALKFIPVPDEAKKRASVIAEARSLALLNHTSIVQIYDVVELDESLVLVLEYVEGTDLWHLMAACQLESQEVVQLAMEMCSALAQAHESGIVHRDLKAANVLLDSGGHIKLTDFGLADPHSVRSSEVPGGGSPIAIAPEQLGGAVPDVRSDLFSLGVLLYQMLLGRHPYGDASRPQQLLHRLALGRHEPLVALSAIMPPALADLVGELISPAPEARPASAVAVRQRLARLRRDLPLVRADLLRDRASAFARDGDRVAALPANIGKGARSHLLSERQWRPWAGGVGAGPRLAIVLLMLSLVYVAATVVPQRYAQKAVVDVLLSRPQVMQSGTGFNSPSSHKLYRLLETITRAEEGLQLVESGAPNIVSVDVHCNANACGMLVERRQLGAEGRSYYATLLPDAPEAAWRYELSAAMVALFDL